MNIRFQLQFYWLVFLVSVFLPSMGAAQRVTREEIPAELHPWISWVRYHQPNFVCGEIDGKPICSWPGFLLLDISQEGGRFEQSIYAEREVDVILPGSLEHWPIKVVLSNKNAIVLAKSGRPMIRVGRGEHRVVGRFLWSQLPEVLQIPESTAQVVLSLEGESIRYPKRDSTGKLWLQRNQVIQGEDEKLDLEVYRRIDDAVPVFIITRMLINVGGRAREVRLSDTLLKNTIPIELSADLPARLESNGDLYIQVRAGTYRIEIVARTQKSVDSLVLSKRDSIWPQQEIWVWSANEALRQVRISGPSQVDPAQTNLDDDWRNLPAYLMNSGGQMAIKTVRRGEPDPPPNRLDIKRQVWLDLDGIAFTVRDHITGTMQKGWRLDLMQGELGHVSSSAVDQLITQSPKTGKPGVELRKKEIDLLAEWRHKSQLQRIPAVAWSYDLQSLSTTLHLPPGWSLFSASGVDTVETWISAWDLFGFFFVLLVSLAVYKLVGLSWGVVALLTLTLCFHEKDAPYLVWLSLLGSVALLRVLPQGRMRFLVRLIWWGSIVTFVMISLPFSAQQIRTGLYPQTNQQAHRFNFTPFDRDIPAAAVPLERSSQGELENLEMEDNAEVSLVEEEFVDQQAGSPPQPSLSQEKTDVVHPKKERVKSGARRVLKTASKSARNLQSQNLQSQSYSKSLVGKHRVALKQDPEAVVQTGPGIPTWTWNSWQLNWSGPVAKDHQIQLRLISPGVNRILSFLRVVLLLLLAFALIRASRPTLHQSSDAHDGNGKNIAISAVSILFFLLCCSGSSRADFPDNELLDDLSERLARPETCHPDCVSVTKLSLLLDGGNLKATAEVHTGDKSGYRIPGPATAWLPNRVIVDGRVSNALVLWEDDFIYLRLEPGYHQVELQGPLPASESLTLALGDMPHRVTVDAQGWQVEGLREDGRAEETIQLSRQLDISQKEALSDQELPPWLEVTREFEIGVTWKIHTTVRRISPIGSPIVLRFPLLPSESVTASHLLTEEKHLVITLNRDQKETSWSSTLKRHDHLSLKASEGKPWSEIWILRCSLVWHCTTASLSPVSHEKQGQWEPEYRPWPGESLDLYFAKPAASVGQSITIDSAELHVVPGVRILKANLKLAIRASKGGQQSLVLPKDARIQKLTVDGNETPIRLQDRKLSINLQPGSHRIDLDWQQEGGIDLIQHVPRVDLATSSVNAKVVVSLPSNRWLLWTQGPSWGPAILFWGYLLFIILIAAVLPRLPNSPLKLSQWVLLGLGLTQIPTEAMIIVVGWFFVVSYRKKYKISRPILFNLSQLALIGWTIAAMGCLYMAIHQGLIFQPDMQVTGAGSTDDQLVWYTDRVERFLPTPWVLSCPLWVFRIGMLVWSLWLALSLLRWLPWSWICFSSQGIWMPMRKKKKTEKKTDVMETDDKK